MNMLTSATFRQLLASLRMIIVLTVLVGVIYPLVIWGIGQAALRHQAEGSQVEYDGHVVGSSLLGQAFTSTQWFHGRPSASNYDPTTTGGTNLGPNSPQLVTQIEQRRAAIAHEDSVPGTVVTPAMVPPDAVTASFSALDPYISPAYARLQVARVAAARNLPAARVAALVAQHIQGRFAGYLGEPRVNVLQLNLALADLR